MTITLRPYSIDDAKAWDEFCIDALQATFLHTQNFLSYHGNRFVDRSLIVEEDGKLIGLFPAASIHEADTCVISHPGISYGGVLHRGRLRGERMLTVMSEIACHYRAQGFSQLLYKAVPTIYHRSPSQDDQYALLRLGAENTRFDLSSTIDLSNRLPVNQRRRRSFKKALKVGADIVEGSQNLPAFWNILAYNLQSKHGVKPVHSIEELILLAERFPHSIRCISALIDEEVVAGVILFVTPTVCHSQYIAANEKGTEHSVLDMVFEHSIGIAIQEKVHWFDFGISTESNGKILNDGLHGFKCEFGGGGVVHNFYELDLAKGMA